MMKACSKCGIEKDEITGFYIPKTRKTKTCKECKKAYFKIYKEKHKQVMKEKGKQYRLINLDKEKDRKDKWRKLNAEKYTKYSKAYNRMYRAKNREFINQKMREWHDKDTGSLSTGYIKQVLRQQGFDANAVIIKAPELLLLKKEIIKIKRLCKQKTNKKQ